MHSDDWMSAGTAAADLEKRYPDWTAGLVRGWRGLRFMAVRDDLAPGLCAVIGTYAEVRAALEADRRIALRMAS